MPPDTPTTPANPQPSTPGVYGPPSSGQSFSGGAKPKNKLPLIIAAGVAGVFVILIILAVVIYNRSPSAPEQEQQQTPTVDPEGPQAATPLDVENTDNSITQDLGSINDDNELPADQLSDDNLNL